MKKADLISLFEAHPIFTKRTRLVPMAEGDLNDFLEHTVCSFSLNGTELESLFKDKCTELLSSETEITFAIRLKEQNTYIGYFELKELIAKPEIGLDLIETYQRQGIGLEVCKAVLDCIFNNTDTDSIRYNCFRSNVASLKLARKLGAIRVEERVLFEKLQNAGLSQETIDESVAFDLIVHEIRRQDWCRLC